MLRTMDYRTALPAILLLIALNRGVGQETEDYEKPPLNYSRAVPHDSAALFQSRLAKAEMLPPESDREFVKMLLHELGIPSESQLLVFSRTSFQRHRINPHQPRALYFNDTCYVGWVP